MKIFNRGQNAPAGPAATVAPSPEEKPAEAPQAAPPQPAAAPTSDPEITKILESSVKDISEKVARLANHVETTGSDREAFESKLSQMEDRMRKLSSLTEMISAQYNPFIGDAPSEREPLPAAEAGLAAPPMAVEDDAFDAFPVAAAPPVSMPSMVAPHDPFPSFADPEAHAAPAATPMESAHMEPADGVHVERFSDDFQSQMVLIKWADLLLQNTQSRASVSDLLGYYHNIGWLGDVARDQLLAYVDGIAFDENPDVHEDWRATAEFHEVSLLFLEKLKSLTRGGR